MLKRLYGHSEETDRVRVSSDIQYESYYAVDTFEDHLKERKEFKMNFFSNILFLVIGKFCCCLHTCCNRRISIRRGSNKYKKFMQAIQRLSKEQDIQHMIEMNRISRLLHKMNFLQRQRHAVSYSHKFVVTDQDIWKLQARTQKVSKEKFNDSETRIKAILKGFDPVNDKQDRCILYEITGMRLQVDEFRDGESSDSHSEEGSDDDVNEIDYAFMQKGKSEAQ